MQVARVATSQRQSPLTLTAASRCFSGQQYRSAESSKLLTALCKLNFFRITLQSSLPISSSFSQKQHQRRALLTDPVLCRELQRRSDILLRRGWPETSELGRISER